MITVAVAGSKGGTGKTTLSAALAVRAHREGKRIALVDLDPQKSLVQWCQRRGVAPDDDRFCIFTGVDSAADAIERASLTGWDWVFLDGPPAFIQVMKDMIDATDFTPGEAVHARSPGHTRCRGAGTRGRSGISRRDQ